MKTNKIHLFVIIIPLFMMSCGSDEPAKVSPAKAEAAFNAANDQIATELAAFYEAPGFTAMNSLSSLNSSANPFGRMKSLKRTEVKDQLKSGLYSLRSMLLSSAAEGRVSGDEPFNYNEKKGTYTYNFETDDFDYTAGGSIVKILFPTENSLTNDGEFQLTAYQEKSTPNGDDMYSITLLQATIFVDGTKEAEIDLDASYGSDDDMEKVDLYLFLNPFTVDLNFDDSKSTATSFSASLSKSGDVIIGFGLDVVFQTADKDEPKSVNGHVQLMNIRFVIKIDTSNPNANDINDLIDITIKIDGAVAGKVIFEQDSLTGELVPYVKYNDGSTELLETLFDNLATQLEGII